MALIPPPVPLEEITHLLQQLTSIPSVESERAIATCVANKLSSLGFEPHLIGSEEHPSVICHYQPAHATKTIWLQAHLDTAPVGNYYHWEHDPFAGTIVGEPRGICEAARIYERGVADVSPNCRLR